MAMFSVALGRLCRKRCDFFVLRSRIIHCCGARGESGRAATRRRQSKPQPEPTCCFRGCCCCCCCYARVYCCVLFFHCCRVSARQHLGLGQNGQRACICGSASCFSCFCRRCVCGFSCSCSCRHCSPSLWSRPWSSMSVPASSCSARPKQLFGPQNILQ